MPPARPRSVILAVDGPSAAGKSTLVARAARELGWVPLAEAYDRVDPPIDLRFSGPDELAAIERTLLAEEARRWRAARALRDRGWTVVADTDFLGPLTYTAGLVALGRAPASLLRALVGEGRRLARRRSFGMPDALVYLTTSPKVRRHRVAGDPGRHPVDLAERHELVGAFEERFYRHRLSAQFPGRLRELSGERPVERVLAEFRRFARTVRPASGTDRSIEGVLDLFAADTSDGRSLRGSATVKKPSPSPRAPRG